jgi:hypothetical protein
MLSDTKQPHRVVMDQRTDRLVSGDLSKDRYSLTQQTTRNAPHFYEFMELE